MNIIVTTPKSEIETSRQEGVTVEKQGGSWFRVFRFKPNVRITDRIYFVENGIITGYGIIFDLYQIDDPEMCEITGRPWGRRGDWVLYYKDWHWLNKSEPVPLKGFQGFRYIERLPEDIKEKLNER